MIKINKSSVPIIWLDTSVLMNMTKSRIETGTNLVNYERESLLFDAIYSAVRDKKLICPKGDQQEEHTGPTNKLKDFLETQSNLSLGICLRHRYDIYDFQAQSSMKVYIDQSEAHYVEYKDAFCGDPVIKIQNMGQFYVEVYGKISNELRAMEKLHKNSYLKNLRLLKRARHDSNITFQEQLETEYTSDYQIVLNTKRLLSDNTNGQRPPIAYEIEHIIETERIFSLWKLHHEPPYDLDELLIFLRSSEWKATPYKDISSRLWAKIITNSGSVATGDGMDISQLSAILPYCDYIICDNTMKNLVRELELDSKYEARVCSISDIDEILTWIKKL